MTPSRSLRFLSRAILLTALVGGAALAQVASCPQGSQRTQASCGNDTCECSAECTTPEQCDSGCCFQGFCAVACVCATNSGATVNMDCATAGGCGGSSVAPAGPVPTDGAFGWGAGLLALGGIGLAGARKGNRKWTLRTGLVLILAGTAVVTASLTQTAPISVVKGLKQTAAR